MIENTIKIILLLGTSGSGKSTWVKSLRLGKYTIISLDDMRIEFTNDINNKSKDDELYELVKKRTIKSIIKGKSVIVDTTNLQRDRRRDFTNSILAVLPEIRLEYKLMPLNPELAKQRIRLQIERGEYRSNVSDATIDRHADLYKEMLKDIKDEPLINFDLNA